MKKNKVIVDVLLLILVTLLTYWPVSFFLFSLKNDSLVQYLPFRYHLSEAIQNGYFPFWSPYLYTGFPIHADMQGMTWNPVVWLISIFTRYNMSVLEFEVTIYLVLAALGMYSLLRAFSFERLICLVGAVAYMSCGFITDSASVIPWISSAAFIPFVLRYLLLFLKDKTLKRSFQLAIAASLLFLCGYPSFFIFTGYLLIIILAVHITLHFKKNSSKESINILLLATLSAIIFSLICGPAIISYWQFLPYYARGQGLNFTKAASNPFPLFSSISLLLPNAVSKPHNWLDTDISMRNGYVGMFIFLAFLLSFRKKINRTQKLVLAASIFCFLYSLGDLTPLYKICYTVLPLFNTFRHPGNFRLFTSIGLILLASFWLKEIFSTGTNRKQYVPVFYFLALIFVIVVVIELLAGNIVKNLGDSLKQQSPKEILDAVSFSSIAGIEAIIQVIFLLLFIFLVRKDALPVKKLALLFGANSILFAWIALPFTFISQVKTKTINNYVHSFPKGYPLIKAEDPVQAAVSSDSVGVSPYGYENFYSKKVTIQDHFISPTINKAYVDFCQDKPLRSLMADYPFAYFPDSLLAMEPKEYNGQKRFALIDSANELLKTSPGPKSIVLLDLEPNKAVFRADVADTSLLAIFQQYNPNWAVRIDGRPTKVYKVNIAFMGVRVPAGKTRIEFVYEPTAVIKAMYFALITIVLLGAYFLVNPLSRRPKR